MIFKKKYSKQKQATRSRKLVPRTEIPSDGISWRRSKVDGELQQFCVTTDAKRQRRIEVWMQAKGDCQSCGHSVGDPEDDGYHWHHKKHRSQGGDDSLANAQCLCRRCHGLVHGIKVK